MATIQQTIALIDGVTPVFNKITQSMSKTIDKFKDTAKAATGLERAAAAGATAVGSMVDRVRNYFGGLGGEIRGIGNSIKNSLSGTLGQFTLGNMLADGIMKAVNAAAQLPGKLIAASDAYAGIQARLRLVAGGAEQAEALNQKIYESAQRARGSYDQMADSVSKIAMTAKEAFPDPKEVVPFMEGIQKLFVIGGTSTENQKNALLQLTQALGSGRLQGDEFRSIAEAAPVIEQMVAKTMGVTQGELKGLSTQGEVTAAIIKQAILSNLEEINETFEKMGWKWADRMTIVGNAGQWAMRKVYEQLNRLANSKAGETLMNSLVALANVAAYAVEGLINNLIWVGNIISDNWAFVQPILAGFVVAIGVLAVAAVWELIGAVAALEIVASPILVVAGAVAAAIAAFYFAVEAVNKFMGTSISATGVIFGAFMWLFTGVMNGVKLIANVIIAWANLLGSVFVDPLGAAYNFFVDVWNAIVGFVGEAVNSIIDMIMKIPGIDKVIGGRPTIDIRTVERKEIAGAAWHIDSFEYGNRTYNAEQAYKTGAEGWSPEFNIPGMDELGSGLGKELDGIGDDAGDTAKNTGKMAEAMEITDEELKYLRDFAEQEAINKYTTAEVKIDMGGISNNISSDIDVDGMMTYINDSLISAMQAGAEEVHP